jgi:hypothetical protein
VNGFLASDPAVFGLFTVVIMGGAGYLTGQAVASTWRPAWQAVLYSLLLGVADRFLVFALFGGTLLSVRGYLVDTAAILILCFAGYRLTRVRRMVSQYPWLYERDGAFRWRKRGG